MILNRRIAWMALCTAVMTPVLFNNAQTHAEEAEETAKVEWNGLSVSFLNAEETKDNPWGMTGCLLDSAPYSGCVFMSPGVEMEISSQGMESASLWLRIDERMSDISDGVDIRVQTFEDEDVPYAEETLISVEGGAEWTEYSLFSGAADKNIRIIFSCYNGSKDDSSGDWLIVSSVDPETLPSEDMPSGDTSSEPASSETPEKPDFLKMKDAGETEEWNGYSLLLEGEAEKEDNPWGKNVGVIESDDAEYVLLTPGTAVNVIEPDPDTAFALRCKIFPAVQEISDGAVLEIWLLDEEDEILHTDSVEIGKEDEWNMVDLDLSSYQKEVKRIRFSYGSQKDKNEDGDWLILSFMNAAGEEAGGRTWNGYSVLFKNEAPADDNPWGSNEGIFEDENGDECIFLMPHTAAEIESPEGKDFILYAGIFPQVRDASDGICMEVTYLDAWGDAVQTEEIAIDPSEDWTTFKAAPADEISYRKIRIECTNTEDHNEAGDWLILSATDPKTHIYKGLGFLHQNDEAAQPEEWSGYSLFFEGSKKTDGNPWKTTAAVIRDKEEDGEEEKEYILLTPDTAVNFVGLSSFEDFAFRGKIHPRTQDISDGVTLDIWFLDEKDDIVASETMDIGSSGEWEIFSGNSADWEDTVSRVRIICHNTEEQNADGDWLIMSLKDTSVLKEADLTSWKNYSLLFENPAECDDNPWKINEGILDTDEGSRIFMTPGAVMDFIHEDSEETYSLEAMIHPEMEDISDGITLQIEYIDGWNEILSESEIKIEAGKGWTDLGIDPEEEVQRIRISFADEKEQNADGDWLIMKNDLSDKSTFGRDGYVCSATYFGNEWPINFWNSDIGSLEEDMLQIRNDGFNSIILVVPWREFQPEMAPAGYNDYAFEKLDRILQAAEGASLDVYVRLGYYWDFYNDVQDSLSDRYEALFSDDEIRTAWSEYAARLYSELEKYENFKGGFLTWEDFWGIIGTCSTGDEKTRIDKAAAIGYQTWATETYSLDGYNEQFHCRYKSGEEIPLPYVDEPSMEAMYAFFDEFLSGILKDTQKVFPNISMEVRLDADPVTQEDQTTGYYYHTDTFMCEDSDLTAVMYGIPMGFENNGERVSAEEAIEKTDYVLKNLYQEIDGKPVYAEQFLFIDNNPVLTDNVQLKEDEVEKYLEMAGPVLKDYTKGYGIWAYRDYRNNMLYNSSFALEKEGWICSEGVSIEEEGSNVCVLAAGESIRQEIPKLRNHFNSDMYTLEFEVTSVQEQGVLQVKMGDAAEKTDITEPGIYSVQLSASGDFDLEIKAEEGKIAVDHLCLYSFVQKSGLYDALNNEGEYIEGIRKLNAFLQTGAEE